MTVKGVMRAFGEPLLIGLVEVAFLPIGLIVVPLIVLVIMVYGLAFWWIIALAVAWRYLWPRYIHLVLYRWTWAATSDQTSPHD